MTLDAPTADAQVVWVRYITAMVAPLLDRDTAADRLDAGWRLVVENPVARAALTHWFELTFDLHDRTARPACIGHCGERAGHTGVVISDRDAVLDSLPRATRGSRTVRAAISRAVRQELRVVVHRVAAPPGQPPQLNGLRLVVDRWVATWIARTGRRARVGDLVGAPPRVQQPSVAASLLVNGLWDTVWAFEPSDLELAVRSVWAEVSAADIDDDPVVEAAKHARDAWAAAEAWMAADVPEHAAVAAVPRACRAAPLL